MCFPVNFAEFVRTPFLTEVAASRYYVELCNIFDETNSQQSYIFKQDSLTSHKVIQ